jgi:uncharacterized membrane protein
MSIMTDMKFLVAFLMLYTLVFTLHEPLRVYAQDTTPIATEEAPFPLVTKEEHFEATVTKILYEKDEILYGSPQHIQELELLIETGKLKGKKLTVTSGGLVSSGTSRYDVHDRVIVAQLYQPDGTSEFFIVDYVRRDALLLLFALFTCTTIVVAGKRGIASLLGMAYSFFIIFSFVIPNIAQGGNPILIALAGGIMIIPVTFYMSHGFNTKTHTAIAGTVICLFITGVLSELAIEWAHLTGFASEDANFVQLMSNGSVNIKGLLLAGIIVGLFGILDDITISQAAIVAQLKETSPHLSFAQLYKRSMDVGKDHIGSLINTLILVYAGAALPFLLLITANGQSLATTINYEIIAEEIVRTLTASIGLILAVPITTFIAARKWR